MERITLSIPTEMRRELRKLAHEQDRREAELARELLGRALAAERREAFYRAVESSMTPELAQRVEALAGAMEVLRGDQG